jgi:hypothetical protein
MPGPQPNPSSPPWRGTRGDTEKEGGTVNDGVQILSVSFEARATMIGAVVALPTTSARGDAPSTTGGFDAGAHGPEDWDR